MYRTRTRPYSRTRPTHARNSSSRRHASSRPRHTRTLPVAWTEEYARRIADPSWQTRKDDYYALHKYRCRGCRRRHNLVVHHKSYRRLWHERDRDLVYACPRCHKHIHTIQHRAFPGTHFALRLISNYYLLQRFALHCIGTLLFIALVTSTVTLAVVWGGLAYLSPTDLNRVNQCIILRVQYAAPTIEQLALCK